MLFGAYSIGQAIEFNLIYIILGVISAIMASHTALAWLPYGIGTGFNIIALIGRYRSYAVYAAYGIHVGIGLDVILFVILAIAFGLYIIKTRNECSASSSYSYIRHDPSRKMYPNATSDSEEKAPAKKLDEDGVICPFCKKVYPVGTVDCEDCKATIGHQ